MKKSNESYRNLQGCFDRNGSSPQDLHLLYSGLDY